MSAEAVECVPSYYAWAFYASIALFIVVRLLPLPPQREHLRLPFSIAFGIATFATGFATLFHYFLTDWREGCW